MTNTTINLNKYFRRDSHARTIAERLMTGKPRTRQELTEDLGVSVTTVNRVVDILEEAGAIVTRTIAEDGRQARFHVVAVAEPKARRRFPNIEDEVEVTGAYKIGDAVMIEIASDRASFRGQLRTLSKFIPVGANGKVNGINSTGDGLADVQLRVGDKNLVIEALQNVTAW